MNGPWGVIYVCRHCGVRVAHVYRYSRRDDDETAIRWREVKDWGCGDCFERRVALATALREDTERELRRIADGILIHDGVGT